jgi:hypothetical protein
MTNPQRNASHFEHSLSAEEDHGTIIADLRQEQAHWIHDGWINDTSIRNVISSGAQQLQGERRGIDYPSRSHSTA